ncbi:hypothetical protein O181_026717 [Austropuccinia psidii MF-1]|uniref:Uncharacterized protein n=1 Tax=Austropuccinia psidii MF-1 TaxID=1389203 RepID=A0A9Q3H110_9BASI|nr:hypothetical protein [Austropuccinia psidii MF-1]
MGVAVILTWNQVGANWPHHIFYGQLVPSGALWPFGHTLPSLASLANFHITNPQACLWAVIQGPRFVGQLGPFWHNPMRPKGGSQVGPKPQLDPPEPILAISPKDTKMAIEPVGPNLGHGPLFQPWPLATTRGHQTSSASTPLNLRGVLSIP